GGEGVGVPLGSARVAPGRVGAGAGPAEREVAGMGGSWLAPLPAGRRAETVDPLGRSGRTAAPPQAHGPVATPRSRPSRVPDDAQAAGKTMNRAAYWVQPG